MKLAQSIAAHAILAVGGLTWAYLVWTDDGPEVDEGEVTILECDPSALTHVELRTEDKDVTLEMREEHGDRTAWLTVTRRPEHGDPTTEHFVGSEAVSEWLAQVAPLRAKRSLGELSESQLHDVGLDHPEGRITLRCGGQRATYQLGGRAYGNGDRYVRSDRGGPVYLVAADRLSPLESAEFRLMERELHTFGQREIVSISIHAFDQEKRLLQHNRLDEQRADWVDAAAPDRRDETYGNWLSRFPRLRVQRYLDADAQPGADLEGMSVAPARVMRMDYQGESDALGFLEMARVGGAEQAYYARTETTRSWVRVPTSVAQQIEDDLRSMLGVEPIEHPSPAAPHANEASPHGEPGATNGETSGASPSDSPAPSAGTQGAPSPAAPHGAAPAPNGAATAPHGAAPAPHAAAPAPHGGAAPAPAPRSAPAAGAAPESSSP